MVDRIRRAVVARDLAVLGEALKQRDPGGVRWTLGEFLWYRSDAALLDLRATVPPLMECLGDEDPERRAAAAWALAEVVGALREGRHFDALREQLFPSLVNALGDDRERVKVGAAVTLGHFAPQHRLRILELADRLGAGHSDRRDKARSTLEELLRPGS